jgi:uncharacterized protein YbaP (TraB family)
MQTAFFRRLLCAVTLLAPLAFLATPSRAADDAPKKPVDNGKCLMWKATSDTATVYLVGSIHLGLPKMYPLPKEMEEAFTKSDILVVEIDMNKMDQGKMLEMVMKKGIYTPPDSLPEKLSKEGAKSLHEAVTKLGLPETAFDQMKPWLAEMSLTMMAAMKDGFQEDKGIDKYFLTKAAEAKKPVEELESADFQLNMLSGIEEAKQIKMLEISLKEHKEHMDDLRNIADAWIAGDADGMADLMTRDDKKHPEFADFTKAMLEDRNGPMAEKAEKYLKGNKTVFIVVGAAHLVGDKGIVKILQDKKYKVEQSPATRDKKTERQL